MHELISAGRMSGFSMQNPEEHVGDRDTARKNYLRILPSLVQRLRHKRAEVGLYYMLRILVLDFLVPSWLFDTRDFALLVWDFDRSPPAEPSEPGIRSAAKSDTALLCQLGRPAAEISKRFEEGASTSVVTQSGELQGYHWVKPGPWFKLAWLAFQPSSPNDIFSLDTRVKWSYRGRDLARQLRWHAAARAKRQGYRRMYCTIDTHNRNSLRAAQKVGYHPIARLRFFRLLGLTLILVDDRRRLGFWTRRRPLIIPVASFEGFQGT